jgi:Flp pilus assembly protein TadG
MRMTKPTGKGAWQSRRGTAAVEFILILPVLMILLLGCIDFGRFPHSYLAVTNAARAGAGFGSVNPYTTATATTWKADIKSAVVDEMSKLNGFDKTQLTVTSLYIDDGNGLWRVKVTVSYPFQCVVSWPGLPTTMTMQQVAVMRGTR